MENLILESKKYNFLTKEIIYKIIKHNSMSSKIETGYRSWVFQHWSMPYESKIDGIEIDYYVCKYLMDLADVIENISCHPIEKNITDLVSKIHKISDKLFELHLKLLNS